MKKIFLISVVIVTVLSFQSCKKFLDLKPESQGVAVENASSDSVLYLSLIHI